MRRGAFLVLEALDGVEKKTLARDLVVELGGVYMDTPGEPLRAASEQVLTRLGPQ